MASEYECKCGQCKPRQPMAARRGPVPADPEGDRVAAAVAKRMAVGQ